MSMLWSQDSYTRAMMFAADAHGDQRVPGRPYSYVVHLANVSMEVIAILPESKGVRSDLALQCAILHDVLEDTSVGAEEIEAEFGSEVSRGVQALTKNKKLPKPEQMKDSLRRILRQPVEIGLVKMADRISNLTEPPADWLEDKIIAYHEEAGLILQNLKHCSSLLADRLKQKIETYRRYFLLKA
jgi:(p)ppGpp synthase/HD superfamily hydrolase